MNIIESLEIIDTAYGGFGVGKDQSGKVVFVPHTVEGDVVDVEITDSRRHFSNASVKNIVKKSKLRKQPRCPYINKCGGCLFGHIDYDAQINIKNKIIHNAFRKYRHPLPKIDNFTSPNEEYRLRASFKANNGEIGFFAFKTNNFIPIRNCCVVKNSLFKKAETIINKCNITGEVYVIENESGTALSAVNGKLIRTNDIAPFAGMMINNQRYGIDNIGFETGFGVVGTGCNTFFQANRFLLNKFQEQAISYLNRQERVVELYAGSGFFTAGILNVSSNISAVENNGYSVDIANKYGYSIKLFDSAAFLRNVDKADVIFLDPPRSGVSKSVIESIKRIKPNRIVYISCAPDTLARDLISLSDEYVLKKYDMFDMFPDTYHIESICMLEKCG